MNDQRGLQVKFHANGLTSNAIALPFDAKPVVRSGHMRHHDSIFNVWDAVMTDDSESKHGPTRKMGAVKKTVKVGTVEEETKLERPSVSHAKPDGDINTSETIPMPTIPPMEDVPPEAASEETVDLKQQAILENLANDREERNRRLPTAKSPAAQFQTEQKPPTQQGYDPPPDSKTIEMSAIESKTQQFGTVSQPEDTAPSTSEAVQFATRLQEGNRLSVPADIRAHVGLEPGDQILVTIRKLDNE